MGHGDRPPCSRPWQASTARRCRRWRPSTNQNHDVTRVTHLFRSTHRTRRQEPLVARFGETPLHRQKAARVDSQLIQVDHPHKQILTRLLADTCELCGTVGNVEVHHIRKLAELGIPGPIQPQWMTAMANRRRKTLVVCATCHSHIHTGQPSAPLTQ
ncbi:hypothetical protein [Nocardia amamiensis]|uniref:HNH endonuclease n=1 Tax=Nocardia amamiensis TaxID=404578 RepID=UPI0033DC7E32